MSERLNRNWFLKLLEVFWNLFTGGGRKKKKTVNVVKEETKKKSE